MHDFAADDARGKLATAVLDELRLAHARHSTAVGMGAVRTYLRGDAVGGLARIDRERANLAAADGWLAAKVVEGFSPSNRLPGPDSPASEAGRAKARDYFPAAARQFIALVRAVADTGDRRFHPPQRIGWLESPLRAEAIARSDAALAIFEASEDPNAAKIRAGLAEWRWT